MQEQKDHVDTVAVAVVVRQGKSHRYQECWLVPSGIGERGTCEEMPGKAHQPSRRHCSNMASMRRTELYVRMELRDGNATTNLNVRFRFDAVDVGCCCF